MRWNSAFFLLLLVACSGSRCPNGYVSSELNGSAVCISAPSYCVRDEQCTSANFDCKRPCVPQGVNVLFSQEAHEKGAECGRNDIRCMQVAYVDNRCVANQCRVTAHLAKDVIPLPQLREVEEGVNGCYVRKGADSVILLAVFNNASTPLGQLAALVNVSQANGSSVVAQVDLLEAPMEGQEEREIRQRVNNGTPTVIDLYAVRKVKTPQLEIGMKNRDQLIQVRLQQCRAKV